MIKESSDFKDRRKFVRVNIYAVTRYFCSLRDTEVGIQTRISDLSEAGAMIVTFAEGVPLGAKVKMGFLVPGNEERLVSVEGVVRHAGPLEKDLFRSGIEFFKLKKNNWRAIHEYVAAHRKK